MRANSSRSFLLSCAGIFGLSVAIASAVTFTVNSPADVPDANPGDGKCETAAGNGVCTLRAAVMEANHTPGGATINFGLAGAVTYKLSIPPTGDPKAEASGSLKVYTSNVTIAGNGPTNTIIDGNSTDRVFSMGDPPSPTPSPAPTPTYNISGVTIANGKHNYTSSDSNSLGGAIFTNVPLTLTNVVVRDNSSNANTGAAYGGGIYAGAALTLNNCTVTGNTVTTVSGGIASGAGILGSPTVINSTISNNIARDHGGGILGSPKLIGSTMTGNTAGNGGAISGGGTLINSTISGNSATTHGGGIYHNGGGLALYNATIANNTANKNGTQGGFGGGVYSVTGTVSFQNSIIGDNIHAAPTGSGHLLLAVADDISGNVTSGGHNIVSTCDSSTNCTITGSGTTITSPNLSPLADHGGPTQTSAPAQASPAIDGGNPGGCTDNLGAILTTDQRGYTRNGPCDIGAFEVGGKLGHYLGNISTRGFVGTGNNVLIGGLIVSGSGPKQVLVRALGPTLTQFNVPGVLADPALDLYDASNNLIASNDDWQSASNAAQVTATGFAPPNSKEPAILTSLNPGNYTAIVHGAGSGTGLSLVEGYDLDPTAGSKFGNISTRGFVQTGDGVMIAGVIIKGPNAQDAVIRGIGPTLGTFGVPNVLADPFLDLRDANGNQLATNDNWKSTQQSALQASGYAPPNDNEAAILLTLNPGNYTAILSGVNGGTGNALVEVYGTN